MNELRSGSADSARFRARILAAGLMVLLGFGLVAARLVVLQVALHESLTEQAESNRTAVVPIVPNRGLILDRNGIPLAVNYKAYTLEITPGKVGGAGLDATIDELGTLVDIESRDRRRFKRLLEDSKGLESLPIKTRLSDEEVARFIAQRYRFPGVDVKARLFRHYPLPRTREPRDRLHRPREPARKRRDGGVARGRRRTTAAPTSSASSGSSKASRPSCTARPAWKSSKRPPAVTRCACSTAARRHQATAWCCRSTSSCRSWWKTCSATGAARSSHWTREMAKCSRSSACRGSTRTFS